MYHFHHISVEFIDNKYIYKYDYSAYLNNTSFDYSLNRLLHTECINDYELDDETLQKWWKTIEHFESYPNKSILLLVSENELNEPLIIFDFIFN